MLTFPEQVRLEGNLPDTVEDCILNPLITKAVNDMKKIITAAKYAEIAALEDDHEDKVICAIAEANLTLYYAIPVLNIETHGTGIVTSKGWGKSKSDVASQNDIEKQKKHFKNTAMSLLKPYIPRNRSAVEVPGDEIRGINHRLIAV